MKSSPASSFIMAEAQFLLEFAIVPLDPPSHLRHGDELVQGHRFRQGRQPIFERLLYARRRHVPQHADYGGSRACRPIATIGVIVRPPGHNSDLLPGSWSEFGEKFSVSDPHPISGPV